MTKALRQCQISRSVSRGTTSGQLQRNTLPSPCRASGSPSGGPLASWTWCHTRFSWSFVPLQISSTQIKLPLHHSPSTPEMQYKVPM